MQSCMFVSHTCILSLSVLDQSDELVVHSVKQHNQLLMHFWIVHQHSQSHIYSVHLSWYIIVFSCTYTHIYTLSSSRYITNVHMHTCLHVLFFLISYTKHTPACLALFYFSRINTRARSPAYAHIHIHTHMFIIHIIIT